MVVWWFPIMFFTLVFISDLAELRPFLTDWSSSRHSICQKQWCTVTSQVWRSYESLLHRRSGILLLMEAWLPWLTRLEQAMISLKKNSERRLKENRPQGDGIRGIQCSIFRTVNETGLVNIGQNNRHTRVLGSQACLLNKIRGTIWLG